MKVVIESAHFDQSGGGNIALQLARAFSRFTDVYIRGKLRNIEFLSGVSRLSFKSFDETFQPDLYLSISYQQQLEPIGRVNACWCFFPRAKVSGGYDYALCQSEFVEDWEKRRWGFETFRLNPSVDLERFEIKTKENILLSVGNFIWDEDQNSKNQHFIIDWFNKSGLWQTQKLILCGFACSPEYYTQIVSQALKSRNVYVINAVSFTVLRDLYARSSYLIHAMGYSKTDPSQVEHFGIVVLEALASGCQPLVHDSGGSREIRGVKLWKEFSEIKLQETNPAFLRTCAQEYSFEKMCSRVQEFVVLVEKKL